MRTALALLAAMLFATAASALSLADISAKDAGGGLREALTQGAGKAVGLLGRQDGFLGNPAVRIALPENLQKVEGAMRKLGMGRQADELVTAMNRAAEAAVPQARALLLNSIRQMSLDDAKGILAGGEDSATQYFRRTTSGPMAEKFRPVVRGAMAKVKLAEKYEQFAGKAARPPHQRCRGWAGAHCDKQSLPGFPGVADALGLPVGQHVLADMLGGEPQRQFPQGRKVAGTEVMFLRRARGFG